MGGPGSGRRPGSGLRKKVVLHKLGKSKSKARKVTKNTINWLRGKITGTGPRYI